jgi:septal ring factor EnvC (AmiA/AmiB activator)
VSLQKIREVSDQISAMDKDIENHEATIKAIRKERSKLVAKRFRLQKADGLV